MKILPRAPCLPKVVRSNGSPSCLACHGTQQENRTLLYAHRVISTNTEILWQTEEAGLTLELGGTEPATSDCTGFWYVTHQRVSRDGGFRNP